MKPSIPTESGLGRKAEGLDDFGGAPFPIWTDTETSVPETGRTTHTAPVAADDQAAPGAPPCRSIQLRDLTGEAFVTMDETGADVLISESRTVSEVIRQVREGALREMAGDPRRNSRTRHLRRMRHRHGH